LRAARGAALFERLKAGDVDGARSDFGPDMLQKLSPSAMAELWKQIQARLGSFTSCAFRGEGAASSVVVRSYECTFERAPIGAKVAFDHDDKIAGLFFVPLASLANEATGDEADPRFVSRTIAIGPADASLPGVLTLPRGAQKVPAVVLVHGSGPNDRDETIGASKPFRDLALGLAARGIAVVRYDKRSLAHPKELASKKDLTVKEEVLDDVLAAIDLLASQPEIDSRRIVVLGHSLGATLAPRIARADGRVSAIVLLAPAARPLGELAAEQADFVERTKKNISAEERNELETLRREARRTVDPSLSASVTGLILGAPASYWIDLRQYDPVSTARTLDLPILVVHGGRDYQVTARDQELWKRGLDGRPRVVVSLQPTLDHRFVSGTGPSTPEDYAKPGHVDTALLDLVGTFVQSVVP
jgi:dienelactone hydrolase